MKLLESLQSRVSITKLSEPAPTKTILAEVFKVAARAADHGKLQPWRFLVIEDDGLRELSQVFVQAIMHSSPDISPSILEKTRNMPFRAPMIIVAIAKCQAHPKVPRQEQVIACGAATQNMLNALFILGFGAVWRTGDFAYDERVKDALGLHVDEEIIGFIYTGTPNQEIPAPPTVDPASLFTAWPHN